jgi:hypothetical protein
MKVRFEPSIDGTKQYGDWFFSLSVDKNKKKFIYQTNWVSLLDSDQKDNLTSWFFVKEF